MKADTLRTFARVRASALAAMIDAGGQPCWVAVGPSAGDVTQSAVLKAGDITRAVGPSAAAATGRTTLPGVQGGKRPVDGELSPAEAARIRDPNGRLVAAMNRALIGLAAAVARPRPPARGG